MFHCLDDDGKRSYAAAVYRATRPGATLSISCFSDTNPAGEEWPRPLEPAMVRRELDGNPVEMAFWYVRAQRR